MGKLGDKLLELRQRKGFGLREAARLLGFSHTRLGDFERGLTRESKRPAIPSRAVILKMAEVYGYPEDTLLELAGMPAQEPKPPRVPTETEAQARELAKIFYELSDHEKRLLLGTARMLMAERDTPPYQP